jgi:hypothetical protein
LAICLTILRQLKTFTDIPANGSHFYKFPFNANFKNPEGAIAAPAFKDGIALIS